MSSDSHHSGDEERRALENELNDRTRSQSQSPTLQQRSSNDSVSEGIVLYVSGLARSMQDSDLRELFSPFGKLVRAQVVIDPHVRENRGFGFVSYEDDGSAETAITALHGKDHLGRVLAVERARRTRPRSPTPGKYHGPVRDRDRRFGRDRRDGGGRGSRRRSRSRSRTRYDRSYDRIGYERGDRYAPPPLPSRHSGGGSSAPPYYGSDRGGRDYRPYDRSYDEPYNGRAMPPPSFYPPSRDQYNTGARYDAYIQPHPPPLYMPPSSMNYEQRRYPPPAAPISMPPRPRSPYR